MCNVLKSRKTRSGSKKKTEPFQMKKIANGGKVRHPPAPNKSDDKTPCTMQFLWQTV